MQLRHLPARSMLSKLRSGSAEKQSIKSGNATTELIRWVNYKTEDIGLHSILFSFKDQFRKMLEVENV